MSLKRLLIIAAAFLIPATFFAQDNYPVIGIRDVRPSTWLLQGARVVVDYQTTLEDTDILIRDGKIVEVARGIRVPEGAKVIDLQGKSVYPSFIDLNTNYGVARGGRETQAQITGLDPSVLQMLGGAARQSAQRIMNADYWNQGIRENFDALSMFEPSSSEAAEFRSAGFGTVMTYRNDGIARGTSALVTLADEERANKVVLVDRMATNFSFARGTSADGYPNSQFGSIALLRQFYYDAEWYNALPRGMFHDEALEAERRNRELPKFFDVNNLNEILRAQNLGREFGFSYIVHGNGTEYRRLNDVKESGAILTLPLNFPNAPDVSDPYRAQGVGIAQLKHWEMAPFNPRMVAESGIEFALTSANLRRRADFLGNLRRAVANGLDESLALRALTEIPARIAGAEDMVGAVRPGMVANLLITSGDIFSTDCVIYENWVQGRQYVINPMDAINLSGVYDLNAGTRRYSLEIEHAGNRITARIISGGETIRAEASLNADLINIRFAQDGERVRFSGVVKDSDLIGHGQFGDGDWLAWKATYREPMATRERQQRERTIPEIPGRVMYPFMAYGWYERPQQEDMLIRNATVWTMEDDGILENTDVLVRGGKIVEIGRSIQARNVREIDGTGYHLTPGLIDEHSHIATSATNETGLNITPQVRVKDVINPDSRAIYQQLAGGLTTSHLLHGSANPIGGQGAIIKLRWGAGADELLVENQTTFLKHALGENVKRAGGRFPNTRMGTEQIIRDNYLRALEYAEEWRAYNALSRRERENAIPPRRDLQLEAIADVLEERSFMACHTYVQSETNMIMRLAEEFGIVAHTLVHNNEGYKVADITAEHGAAVSVFSDWWAYKNEVWEGTPYNASMLHEQGVLTVIHSDNAELARRMNQEAGKMVLYGNMDHQDALAMVTINAAKVLHLDDRIGSIKVGKDADLVLWTTNPLSMYARAELTMIEGTVYYEESRDRELNEYFNNERNRIIKKIL